MLNSPLTRSLLAGIAGFFVYGGWAYFANSAHGDAIAMRSGLVQGSYSLALTFVMTLFTEWLYARLSDRSGGIFFLMVIVCALLFGTAYGIHVWVGTPEILMTITPGFIIGSIYTLAYVIGLKKSGLASAGERVKA